MLTLAVSSEVCLLLLGVLLAVADTLEFKSITTTKIGPLVTRIANIDPIYQQITQLDRVYGKENSYIGVARLYSPEPRMCCHAIRFDVDIFNDVNVTNFRNRPIPKLLFVNTLVSIPGLAIYAGGMGSMGEHLYYTYTDEEWFQSTEVLDLDLRYQLKEGDDGAQAIFGISGLEYDPKRSVVYIMDYSMMKYMDLRDNKTYYLELEVGAINGFIYGSIGTLSGTMIMRYSSKSNLLWIYFLYGIASIYINETTPLTGTVTIRAGKVRETYYYDAAISKASLTKLGSIVVWNDEVIMATNFETKNPHSLRIIDLKDSTVRSACVPQYRSITVDPPLDGDPLVCTMVTPQALMLVTDRYGEPHVLFSDHNEAALRTIQLNYIGDNVGLPAPLHIILVLVTIATVMMAICVLICRYGCPECFCERLMGQKAADKEYDYIQTADTLSVKKPKSKQKVIKPPPTPESFWGLPSKVEPDQQPEEDVLSDVSDSKKSKKAKKEKKKSRSRENRKSRGSRGLDEPEEPKLRKDEWSYKL